MFTKSKITRRWLRNSFGVIVAAVVIISIIACVSVREYYYSQVNQALEIQANSVSNTFQQYSRESTGSFDEKVRNFVTNFAERERIELMIVNQNGHTTITSSGFSPEAKGMPDYLKAIESQDRVGIAVGRLSNTREKSMIYSRIMPVNDEPSIAAIRLATSLDEVNRQVYFLILAIFTMAVVILGLVLFSSYYFIRGIVRPIERVGETARKIAQGDFDARLNVKNDDEIGELADIINYMAGELSETEMLKNDFISSVSHELRTPLTAIQGWSETILIDKGQDQELVSKGMNVIIGETTRLTGMVEELLDFSKMQSGRLQLVKLPTNPLTELTEAVLMYTQRAQRDKIELKYTPLKEEVVINADKNRLRQVFINIIDNAIKYSDPGGEVTVAALKSNGNLIITVSDTGIGIGQKDLQQIKTKFYKADSTRRGSGIGLAVADEIINSHEGTLSVESTLNQGTKITITLPLESAENNKPAVSGEKNNTESEN